MGFACRSGVLFVETDGLGVDLDAEQQVGLLAEVAAIVEDSLALELVRGDVEVAVVGEAEGVGPEQGGVVGQQLEAAVGGDDVDGVALVVAGVDVAGGVGLEAVGGALAGDQVDGGGDLRGGQVLVAQGGGADAVELAAGERAVEEARAVGAEGDAVGPGDERGCGACRARACRAAGPRRWR